MFTDSHCHITNEDYENIDLIVKISKEKGIYKIINNGTDQNTNIEVLKLSKKYSNIYAAIGIHPEFANDYNEEDINFIEMNIDNIIAIGEIGLDYHYGNNKDKQKQLFETQLKIAEKYNKPVIIHSREATEDTINILKKYNGLKGTIHCFTGSLETAKIYLNLGYKIGIGGVLTFKNSKLYKVIEALPTASFVIETDSLYLCPEPKRGQKNEPANIIYIAKYICKIKNITLQDLSCITEKNIRDIFDI